MLSVAFKLLHPPRVHFISYCYISLAAVAIWCLVLRLKKVAKRPTYIFAGSIRMRGQNSMIFGKCKLPTTRSGDANFKQILS